MLAINAALSYDCPYTHEAYILMILNIVHIESMHHHLIPQFIMSEAELSTNDVSQIQCADPSKDDHCISFKDIGLRISLQLMEYYSI